MASARHWAFPQEVGGDEPGRRIDASGARAGGGLFGRPGAQRPGEQPHGIDRIGPRPAPAGPGQPDERHEVGRHGVGVVRGTGPGLGESHHGLLDRGEVRTPVERARQAFGRGISPLVEDEVGARRGVPLLE
jgi:hypothetical protein